LQGSFSGRLRRIDRTICRPNSQFRLEFKVWKRGRAVEGTGLENRRQRKLFVSSNLTASATTPPLLVVRTITPAGSIPRKHIQPSLCDGALSVAAKT
jgi:hypothetical protein